MPSTEFATIGPGRDYETLDAWEADQQTNLVAAGYIHKATLYKNSPVSTNYGPLTIAGWTTDASHYVDLTVPEAERWDFKDPTTGPSGSGRWYLYAYTRVSYITLQDGYFTQRDGNREALTNACAAFNTTDVYAFDTIDYVYNCLVVNASGSGIANGSATAQKQVMNNTVITTANVGIASTFDSINSDNNAVFAATNDDMSPLISGSATNNITEDTTAMSDFNDFAGGDYSPAVGGKLDPAINPGVDRSSFFLNDITGATRTTWNRGAYSLAAVGPTPAVLSDPTVTPAETSALIGCTTDTAGGTLYWYVSTSATAPSATDLKAGTGAVASGSFTPDLGANTVNATGLTASTNYWHYWIQETT